MGRAILAISGSAAGFLNRPLSNVGATVVALWSDVSHAVFNRYRPERHYMRGPGPAWQAKHGKH